MQKLYILKYQQFFWSSGTFSIAVIMNFQVAAHGLAHDLHREDADNVAVKYAERIDMP